MNIQQMISRSLLIFLAWCTLAVGPTFAQTIITHVPLFTFDGDTRNDDFGWSVSGAGDVNGDGFADVIVGAPRDDNNGTDSGSARVLSGADGSVLYTFDGDSEFNSFGLSVSGAGDVNGDGFDDVIVGAILYGNNFPRGNARVFSGADGSVLYNFDGISPVDNFGWSVSGAGDVNDDGFADLIVGAILDNFPRGSARVFSGVDGSVLYNFDGEYTEDLFGNSVSGAGDVNGDGFDDLIVGASRDDNNGTDSGSARVFSGVDGSVLYNFNGDSAGDLFGGSVSGAGDVNGDGFDDLIVGAYDDDNNGFNTSGSARVLSGVDGSVLYTFDGDSAGDRFGMSVSGAGDVNGDGFDDLVVGAFTDDNNGDRSGSARVFSGFDGSVLYTFDGDSTDQWFGRSVSGAGDVNGDGIADFIVGGVLRGGANNGGYARLFVSQRQQISVLNDYTISTTAEGFDAFEGLGTLSENGYEIILEATDGSNFGFVLAPLITEGVFIDENTQILIEATVGESNDGDLVIAIREDTVAGEFFTVAVPAADLADDGQALVNLKDFFFNGDATDGVLNGTIFTADLQSTYASGNAVDFTVQRVSVLNSSARVLGDADENLIVDLFDIAPFIGLLTSSTFLEQADCNRDGEVNLFDIAPFIEILTAN